MSKCLYCNKENKYDSGIISYLFNDDILCDSCRLKFELRPTIVNLNNLEIESFYLYDDNFKNLLLQYKEANDEALAPIFISKLRSKFLLKYHDYTIVLAPSSDKKLKSRGFNHLKLMFDSYNINTIDILKKETELNQKDLAFDQRKLIIGKIKLKENVHLKKVLVVDDVLTSGSTLVAINNALKDNCQSIKYLTIAYNKHYLKEKKPLLTRIKSKLEVKNVN